jgi:hypothetical protein
MPHAHDGRQAAQPTDKHAPCAAAGARIRTLVVWAPPMVSELPYREREGAQRRGAQHPPHLHRQTRDSGGARARDACCGAAARACVRAVPQPAMMLIAAAARAAPHSPHGTPSSVPTPWCCAAGERASLRHLCGQRARLPLCAAWPPAALLSAAINVHTDCNQTAERGVGNHSSWKA